MFDIFKRLVFLTPLTGKRTQLLVALALVANAYGYVGGIDGFDVTRVDSKLLVQELLIATLGTAAAKFDRLIRR